MSRPPLLSAAMIVKDEEQLLPDALRSIRWLADELVIVDTGSTDGTVDIARSVEGATVIEARWEGWAAARNTALDACTGTWVLTLDADQQVRYHQWHRTIRSQHDGALVTREALKRREPWAAVMHRLADGTETHSAWHLWRRQDWRWQGAVNEQPVPADPDFDPNATQIPLIPGLHVCDTRPLGRNSERDLAAAAALAGTPAGDEPTAGWAAVTAAILTPDPDQARRWITEAETAQAANPGTPYGRWLIDTHLQTARNQLDQPLTGEGSAGEL